MRLALFLLGLAGALLATETLADHMRFPHLQPDDQAMLARGAAVYTAQCAACHGAQLQGQANWQQRGPDGLLPAPPHDETGHTWHHPDPYLFVITKFGPQAVAGQGYVSAMPAYADTLSDADIVAVLSFIKSQWPDEIRARHDEINARAEAQFRQSQQQSQ